MYVLVCECETIVPTVSYYVIGKHDLLPIYFAEGKRIYNYNESNIVNHAVYMCESVKLLFFLHCFVLFLPTQMDHLLRACESPCR